MQRRDFNLGAAALATTAVLGMPRPATAQGKRVFRAANPNNVLDAQQAFATLGQQMAFERELNEIIEVARTKGRLHEPVLRQRIVGRIRHGRVR